MKYWLCFLLPCLMGFTVPPLSRAIMDDAHLIQPSTKAALEEGLRALHDQGGSQIVVLTVPSLEGLEIEQAAIQITDAWKLGKKGDDRGLLLLIAPQEHRLRIEVGLGLQGVLPDMIAKRIIADTIQPLFKAGDYNAGILLGVREIVRITDPGFLIDPYLQGQLRRKPARSGHVDPGELVLFFCVLAFIIYISRSGGPPRRRGFYHRGPSGPWGPSGGGSWGGSGGGGFSGGGGGFNGGGASGDW